MYHLLLPRQVRTSIPSTYTYVLLAGHILASSPVRGRQHEPVIVANLLESSQLDLKNAKKSGGSERNVELPNAAMGNLKSEGEKHTKNKKGLLPLLELARL